MKIHDGAGEGAIEVVQRELARGVPVDARHPMTGLTPLAEAAGSPAGTPELLQLLIEHGADANAVCGKGGQSALLLGVRSWDVNRLAVLLDAGADITHRSDAGYDVLTSCFYREGARADPRLFDTLAFLVKRGAPLGATSEHGESALSVASRLGRFDVVRLLLDAGDDPSPLGWSELHRAVALGSSSRVEELVSGKADLEARDRRDRTAWLLSLRVGALEKMSSWRPQGLSATREVAAEGTRSCTPSRAVTRTSSTGS
jgi:ankyrin repeat protein